MVGLGCDETALMDPTREEVLFVFRLVDKSEVSIVISDDENQDHEDVKPNISNGIGEIVPPKRRNDIIIPSPEQNDGLLVFILISI